MTPDDQIPVSKERSEEIDSMLGLKMISIRLPKALIEDLKFCARAHGMPYQAFAREALTRESERTIAIIKKLLEEAKE